MKTLDKMVVLQGIEKSKIDIDDYIIFTANNKIFVYSKKTGYFFSTKQKFERETTEILFSTDYCKAVKVKPNKGIEAVNVWNLIVNNSINFEVMEAVGFKSGGHLGKRYEAITFSKNGKKTNIYSHTIVALFKYGLEYMEDILGLGSYYTIDHINQDKRDNRTSNIRILSRTENRWRGNKICRHPAA